MCVYSLFPLCAAVGEDVGLNSSLLTGSKYSPSGSLHIKIKDEAMISKPIYQKGNLLSRILLCVESLVHIYSRRPLTKGNFKSDS